MEDTSRKISIVFLSIVCLTAFFGGAVLIFDPTGGLMGMSVDRLHASPFPDYLFPGIFLFFVLGFGTLAVIIILIGKRKQGPRLVIACGGVLMAWIIVQVIILSEINSFHAFYFTMGAFLIWLGFRQKHGVDGEGIGESTKSQAPNPN